MRPYRGIRATNSECPGKAQPVKGDGEELHNQESRREDSAAVGPKVRLFTKRQLPGYKRA